ncbi:MAG: Fic family protein [Deltaproteobacteria bacterium]|nr:Fic family protein [Deltaproteobacteria bacterium]
MALSKETKQFIDVLIKKKIEDVTRLIYQILDSQKPMNLTEKLNEIDKLKNWLDSFRPLNPSIVEEMKKLYDVKFTYNSNAIEGNTLTQNETEMVLEKGITIGGKSLKEHLEVIGHKEAIDYIEELAQQQTIITDREIKDIHSIIMQGIDKQEAGKYRNLDVRAAGTDHVYPAHYKIQDLMDDFCTWLQADETKNLHPVKFATLAHYRLALIHPFKDGNGRTARLLMNLILLQHGFPVTVIANENRKEYINALIHAQSNKDDIKPFLEIVINAQKKSLIDYLRITSTAPNNEEKGLPFYKEMQAVITQKSSES